MKAFVIKRLLDVGLSLTLYAQFLFLFSISPFFRWWLPLVFMGIFFGQWALAQTFLDKSFATWIERRFGLPITAILALALCGAGGLRTLNHSQRSPLTQSIPRLEIPAQVPLNDDHMLAFFYAMVAMPLTFADQPIFYHVPYEKGPPERFISRIIARLKMPETKLVIEGPRTPTLQGLPLTHAQWDHCIAERPASVYAGECAQVREAALSRHLSDLQEQKLDLISIRWIQIEDSRLEKIAQTRGLLIAAGRAGRTQLRFSAVTPKELQQTFIFETNEGLSAAENTFLPWIAKMRVGSDLSAGKAWIDTALAQVKLDANLSLRELAPIEAKLASKLTVDAKTYDTYFHLGGLAAMIHQKALIDAELKRDAMADWKAVPRPLLEAMVLYARDVNPEDPRNTQLQALLGKIKQ